MSTKDQQSVEARRAFLSQCGKFAAITPVVMTGMLAASKQNFAVAVSGGNVTTRSNNGFGDGSEGVPPPGNSAGKGNGPTGPISDVDR